MRSCNGNRNIIMKSCLRVFQLEYFIIIFLPFTFCKPNKNIRIMMIVQQRGPQIQIPFLPRFVFDTKKKKVIPCFLLYQQLFCGFFVVFLSAAGLLDMHLHYILTWPCCLVFILILLSLLSVHLPEKSYRFFQV